MTPPTPRVGSLFAGYGGLDLGVLAVLGGQVAWHSEIVPDACRVLDARWPSVPNLGDITAVNWSTVPPVDVLTGGFPCQDLSHAGRRAGLRPGTRSGLWAHMAYAIDRLRPGLVVIENVRGITSAPAGSSVEPCPWCLGDTGDGQPAMRALGAVLADLADIGYDAAWHGLRAADVGAPHHRYRIFITAWPAADSDSVGFSRPRRAWDGRPGSTHDSDPATNPDSWGTWRDRRAIPGTPQGTRRTDINVHPAGDARTDPATDTQSDGRDARGTEPAGHVRGSDAPLSGAPAWGRYAPAITRWEHVTGRPAPPPLAVTRAGTWRLSATAVEWMMGLPSGWVTGVPGISRASLLRMLGNGVVPQQAAAGIRACLHIAGASP